MSFNPFSAPLSLKIKPSFQKWLMITIPHIFALFVIGFVGDLSLIVKLVLLIVIIISLIFFSRKHLFQSSKYAVLSIRQDSAKNWFILARGKDELKAVDLMSSSFVSNYFIILNYKPKYSNYLSNKYSVLITKDSLSTDNFRQLKARLIMCM